MDYKHCLFGVYPAIFVCAVCAVCVTNGAPQTDVLKKHCRVLGNTSTVLYCFKVYTGQCGDARWQACGPISDRLNDSLCFPFYEYIKYMRQNNITNITTRTTPCEFHTTVVQGPNGNSTTRFNSASTNSPNSQKIATTVLPFSVNASQHKMHDESLMSRIVIRSAIRRHTFRLSKPIPSAGTETTDDTVNELPHSVMPISASIGSTVTGTSPSTVAIHRTTPIPTTTAESSIVPNVSSTVTKENATTTESSIVPNVSSTITKANATTAESSIVQNVSSTVTKENAITAQSSVVPNVSSTVTKANASPGSTASSSLIDTTPNDSTDLPFTEKQNSVSPVVAVIVAISGLLVGILCTVVTCVASVNAQRLAIKLRECKGKTGSTRHSRGNLLRHDTRTSDGYSEINIAMTSAGNIRQMTTNVEGGDSLLRLRPVSASNYVSLRGDQWYDTIEDKLYTSLRRAGPDNNTEENPYRRHTDKMDESGEHGYFILGAGMISSILVSEALGVQGTGQSNSMGLSDSCRSDHAYSTLDHSDEPKEASHGMKWKRSPFHLDAGNVDKQIPHKGQYEEKGHQHSTGQYFSLKRGGEVILERLSDGQCETQHEYFILQPLSIANVPYTSTKRLSKCDNADIFASAEDLISERVERHSNPEQQRKGIDDVGYDDNSVGLPVNDKHGYVMLDAEAMQKC